MVSASQKSTTELGVGMSKERELLERAYYVLGELSYAMLKDSGEYNLAGDIYEFLSTPEPTQDEEPNKEKALELAHRWCSRYRHGEEFPYLFNEYHLLEFVRRLHPATRPEFVRLSEEELRSCFTETNEAEPLAEGWPGLERFARAIEDALEEKNK